MNIFEPEITWVTREMLDEWAEKPCSGCGHPLFDCHCPDEDELLSDLA